MNKYNKIILRKDLKNTENFYNCLNYLYFLYDIAKNN